MKKPFSLKKFSKYLLSFWGYFTLSLIDDNFSPFSLSLLTANLFIGLNPLTSFILYIIPFLFSLSAMTVLWAGVGGIIVAVSFTFYNKHKKTPSFEIVFILSLALSPYAVLGDRPLPFTIIVACGVIILSLMFVSGARVWIIKGLKYKLSKSEVVSASTIYILCSYGAIIAFGEGFCLSIALLTICFCVLFLNNFTTLFGAIISSIPLSLFRFDFTPIAIISLIALTIFTLYEYSKLASALGGILCIVACYFFTDFFAYYTLYSFIPTISVFMIYLFYPEKTAKKLRSKLKIYTTDNLGRYSVNYTRSNLSGKLYEIAAVFDQMSTSLKKLQNNAIKTTDVYDEICDEIIISSCSTCPQYLKCRAKEFPSEEELTKLVELGFAKGNLSPSDLSKNFISKCENPSKILILANELINKSISINAERENLSESRELIIRQTNGLSDSIKSIASKLGRQLELLPEKERRIYENLLRCGILAKETSVFIGDEEEINLVLRKNDVFNPLFLPSIEEITGYKSIISNITSLSDEFSALTVKKRPNFDAAFGIAIKTKDGKQKSGDTHSVTKLSEGKFLIALNDGMGSGVGAEETSSTAISLVESFYKAGINSEIILSTVNKILTFSKEDNFTAMDLGIVNLFDGSADFIKIGSPFSFIITRDSVKIIEGNSLPLGILDEMKPTVCSSPLKNGDVIVFLSDGISDSFSSSSDLIDFLSTQRALNPKTLADGILERALFLNDGKALDDMTVFCVRIYSSETNVA